jgi:hypothetical protein
MNKPFSKILIEFQTLLNLADQEERDDLNCTFDLLENALEPPGPHQLNLINFMEKLSEEVVFAIILLMYSGQDNKDDPIKYWKTLRSSISSKDIAIGILLEKSNVSKYINKAIERLPSYIVLDNLPSKIISSDLTE